MTTARTTLIAGLKSVKPKTWRIVGVDRNIDVKRNTTITLVQEQIESFPQAPIASVQVKFTLRVTCQYTAREAAEEKFDADIVQLLLAFRTLKLRFDPAVKVEADNEIAYEVPVYVIAKKEPTNG